MSQASHDHDPLRTNLAGITLRNPVILAAGTAGYVDELSDVLDLSRVGAVVTKSITGDPREGNPTWRILETRGGMLNAIGLANVGADVFARDHAPRAAALGTPIIGSIAGSSIDEYVRVARMFDAIEAIPAVEVNVSCPNVKAGCAFGDTPESLSELLLAVREALPDTRMFVKLPPLAIAPPERDIVALARAAIDAGAAALCIANTTPAMAIDPDSRRPRLANVTGGLSGPAVHPIVVRLIHMVHTRIARDAGVPIVGVGGVMDWRDAAECVLAGAVAVQMGTALFVDPRAPLRVADGLRRWVQRQGCDSFAQLVGRVELPGPEGGAA